MKKERDLSQQAHCAPACVSLCCSVPVNKKDLTRCNSLTVDIRNYELNKLLFFVNYLVCAIRLEQQKLVKTVPPLLFIPCFLAVYIYTCAWLIHRKPCPQCCCYSHFIWYALKEMYTELSTAEKLILEPRCAWFQSPGVLVSSVVPSKWRPDELGLSMAKTAWLGVREAKDQDLYSGRGSLTDTRDSVTL